jgi:hypothetical protein
LFILWVVREEKIAGLIPIKTRNQRMMLVRECDREEKNAIAETPATNNSMRRNKEK